MEIGRSFTYIMEDQDWAKKVLLGGAITLIPIVGPFFAMGYVIEVMRNVIAGQETPLPALDDFGGKLVEGLKMWVIAFVYALPLVLLMMCAQSGSLVPALAGNLAPDVFQALTMLSLGVSVCFGCLLLLYSILMGLILPFALGRYAETGEFGAALRVGEFFGMLKDNVGPAIIVLLVNGLAASAAMLVGTIACGVGIFFTMFYAQLVMAFLYGALYRQAAVPRSAQL